MEQRHFLHNAFNSLVTEDFLREQQGVQTLEVVQKLYRIIKEKPRATRVAKDLESLCPPGEFTLLYQAVITFDYEDSHTKEKCHHAVRVSAELDRDIRSTVTLKSRTWCRTS